MMHRKIEEEKHASTAIPISPLSTVSVTALSWLGYAPIQHCDYATENACMRAQRNYVRRTARLASDVQSFQYT